MNKVDQLVDWILNVWDNLGDETTHKEIVDDIDSILHDRDAAEKFVDVWFKEHGELLSACTNAPSVSLSISSYEDAVRDWVKKHLDFSHIS